MLETIEFEPTATGTTIHFRYAAPATAKERAIAAGLVPVYRDIVAARLPRLADLLDAEIAPRRAEQAGEPGLPAPTADGPLAGLAEDAGPRLA
jgi:hypothetical protein